MSDITWPGWKNVDTIGEGSYGTVYKIEREFFGNKEYAALKVISIPQNSRDIQNMYDEGYDEESVTETINGYISAILNEYSTMKKLSGNTNIVNCDEFNYIQHENDAGCDIYIKMELLTPFVKKIKNNVPEEEVLKLGRDICQALVLCQKYSIVHRDIKPENIFISELGDYKLGDFGIAKTVEKTTGGTKIGTYNYMSPEVYNNQPYGPAADIYSLGLVMYWMLNEKRLPFIPLPPNPIKAGMREEARDRRLSGEAIPEPCHGSGELKRIVLKACAYDVDKRYRRANEMLDDILKIMVPKAETSDKESVATTGEAEVKKGTFTLKDENIVGVREFEGRDDLESVVIPNGVSEIGKEAFLNCTKIKSVVIPDSVEKIDEGAFAGCSSLKSINIPESVTKISNRTFEGCKSFKNIAIPESINVIETNAFKGCTGLKTITIPNSSATVNMDAFELTTKVIRVTDKVMAEPVIVAENLSSKTISSDKDEPIIILDSELTTNDAEEKPVKKESKSNVKAESVKKTAKKTPARPDTNADKSAVTLEKTESPIKKRASNLPSGFEDAVVIEPKTPGKIEYREFAGNNSLIKIVIPKDITSIDSYAFMDCKELTHVYFEDRIPLLDGTFYRCSNLKKVHLPNGLLKIGFGTFSDCKSLESVALPDSVGEIGDNAFCGCEKLSSVTFPKSLKSIGSDAFLSCKIDKLELPQGLVKIGGNAFKNSVNSTNLVIPFGVKEICYSAFSNCPSVTSLELPDSLQKIGHSAFAGCSGIKTLIIPEGVTEIGNRAFSNCSSIESVSLPGTLVKIDEYAFEKCTKLKSVDIPKSVIEFSKNVFDPTTVVNGLTTMQKNNTSKAIEASQKNGILESKSPVDSFEKDLQKKVQKTNSVKTTAKPIINEVKSNVSQEKTKNPIKESVSNLPAGFEDAMIIRPKTPGKIEYHEFARKDSLVKIIIPKEVKSIGSYAFENCKKLTHVYIEGKVPLLDAYTFSNCSNLKVIYLPEGLNKIGIGAFSHCKSLENVVLPDSVEIIEDFAFFHCDKLSSVTFSKSLNFIGADAFFSCAALSDIILPKSVKKIKKDAFWGCSKMKTAKVPSNLTTKGFLWNAFSSETKVIKY